MRELPVLQVPGLPDVLSMVDAQPLGTPPARVDAVFGTAKQQYRLLSNDRLVSVDLSDRLGPVGDEGGNLFNPLGPKRLARRHRRCSSGSPAGVEIWDLPTDTWRTVETADYEQADLDPRRPPLAPGLTDAGRPDPWDRGDHQCSRWWPARAAGRRARLDGGHRRADPGVAWPASPTPSSWPPATPADPALLAFGMGRNKICCSPMGWFSHDFVLFSASSPRGGYRVLAWRVGTPDLYRVCEYIDFPRGASRPAGREDAFATAPGSEPLSERPLPAQPGLVALATGGDDGREERLGWGVRRRRRGDVRGDLLRQRAAHRHAGAGIESGGAHQELAHRQRQPGGQ